MMRLIYHITEGNADQRREGAADRLSIHAPRNHRAPSDNSAGRSAARRRRGEDAAAALQPGRLYPRADRAAKSRRHRSGQGHGGGCAGRGRYTIGYGFGFEVLQIGRSLAQAIRRSDPAERLQSERHVKSPPARAAFSRFRAPICLDGRRPSVQGAGQHAEYRSLVVLLSRRLLGGHRPRALHSRALPIRRRTSRRSLRPATRGAVPNRGEIFSPSSSLLYRYFFRRVVAPIWLQRSPRRDSAPKSANAGVRRWNHLRARPPR